MSRALRIHPEDNVAVALEPIRADETISVEGAEVTARQDIPQGHKAALFSISAGEAVVKYGYPIGRAKTAIEPGEWVHTHNLGTSLDTSTAIAAQVVQGGPSPLPPEHFQGYRRAGGGVGIRNELWIVPTVGCVNGIAQTLARRLGRGRGIRQAPPLRLLPNGGGPGAHPAHPLRPHPPPQCGRCAGAGTGL